LAHALRQHGHRSRRGNHRRNRRGDCRRRYRSRLCDLETDEKAAIVGPLQHAESLHLTGAVLDKKAAQQAAKSRFVLIREVRDDYLLGMSAAKFREAGRRLEVLTRPLIRFRYWFFCLRFPPPAWPLCRSHPSPPRQCQE